MTITEGFREARLPLSCEFLILKGSAGASPSRIQAVESWIQDADEWAARDAARLFDSPQTFARRHGPQESS